MVVDVGDAYGGLVSKVRAALQWVAAHNPAEYVAKFDDDCYVAPANLLAELAPLPKERLYYGKMMAGGPIQREGNHRNRETALPRGVNWFPPYASGAGYVLSWDLAQTVAFPSVKRLDMVNEVSAANATGAAAVTVFLARAHAVARLTARTSCTLSGLPTSTPRLRPAFILRIGRPPRHRAAAF